MSTIKIIKVNATKSTNDKVKMLIKSKKINAGQIICAKYQYKGKGQSSKRWYSSYDKNLLCSLYYEFHDLDPRSSYLVNYAVSLAVLKTVKKFITNKTYIKWPNDILSENKKISGILIENTITLKKINNCVIGVGLNVNQTVFNKLPCATSLKKLLGKEINVDQVLNELINNYSFYFRKINDDEYLTCKYLENLYGLNKCKFQLENRILNGKIISVLNNGKIRVNLDTLGINDYSSSEIKIIT